MDYPLHAKGTPNIQTKQKNKQKNETKPRDWF